MFTLLKRPPLILDHSERWSSKRCSIIFQKPISASVPVFCIHGQHCEIHTLKSPGFLYTFYWYLQENAILHMLKFYLHNHTWLSSVLETSNSVMTWLYCSIKYILYSNLVLSFRCVCVLYHWRWVSFAFPQAIPEHMLSSMGPGPHGPSARPRDSHPLAEPPTIPEDEILQGFTIIDKNAGVSVDP